MAKDLPYFKFYVSEWNDGDITMEEMHVQGVFINVCSYYWSNSCNVSIKVLRKRFRNFQNDIDYLLEEGIIKVNNDSVIIDFLCTQLCERGGLSVQNSSNAKKGWEKRRAREKAEAENDAIALDSQSEGEAKSVQYKREEKRREDKREDKREETNIDVDSIYSLYPTKCNTRNSSTGKTGKNKDQIKKLLKTHSKEKLSGIIKRYVKENEKAYMKNFGTFLNNLPDYDSKEVDPDKLEEDYVYYQWTHEPSSIARRIPVKEAKELFDNQAKANRIPKILKTLKGKNPVWNR